jgi:hypothetical protein
MNLLILNGPRTPRDSNARYRGTNRAQQRIQLQRCAAEQLMARSSTSPAFLTVLTQSLRKFGEIVGLLDVVEYDGARCEKRPNVAKSA